MSRRKKRLYFARTEEKKEQAMQSVFAKHAKSSLKPKKMTQFKTENEGPTKKGGVKRKRMFEEEVTKKKK
jgi:hypothetical protein